MPACFIVNPVSGNGAGLRAIAAIQQAAPSEVDVVVTERSGHATELACRAAARGCDPVVAVGGDGTVMEVVQGLMRRGAPPALGIVPVGNGNDLARMLRLPRDPGDATRRLWSGHADLIDVGRCNDRFFLNIGGAGIDTRVAAVMGAGAPRLLRNPAGYLLYGLRELMRYENPAFRIRLDAEVISTRSLLVAIANGRYFAGGMKVCPDAEPDDGWFDVCIAGDLSRFETLALMPRIYFGRHTTHSRVRMRRARRVVIEHPAGLDVQLDGEVVESVPAVFEILPGALRIAGWQAAMLTGRA